MNKIKSHLILNIKPIALIVCCTALGAAFGNPWKGFFIGVAIVAFATTLVK